MHQQAQLFKSVLVRRQGLDRVIQPVRVLQQLHFLSIALCLEESRGACKELLLEIGLIALLDRLINDYLA